VKIVFLVLSNESKMLQTIKSRCIIIKFEELSDNQIAQALNTNDKELIKLCNGSLEKADKIQENRETYNKLKDLVNLLEQGSMVDVFNNADVLYSSKDEIIDLLDFLNIIFFEKSIQNIKVAKAVSIVENTKKKIMSNNNFDMSIDYMLMYIMEECYGKSSRG